MGLKGLAKRVAKTLFAVYVSFWTIITSRFKVGEDLYEEDWDLLIVLDACRVDALRQVESEYDFLTDVESIWSRGSTSKEWIERTFVTAHREQIQNTAYITANPFSHHLYEKGSPLQYNAIIGTLLEDSPHLERLVYDDVVEARDFGHIEPLWGHSDGESNFDELRHPREVSLRAIQAVRSGRFDRTVVHYIQPHAPYFSSAKSYDSLEEYERFPFESLKQGTPLDKVWAAYIDNLRYVLDEVKIVLNNVDADVVITSDHGELFGEAGLYSHHAGVLHPSLRKVPWARATAQNREERDVDVELTGDREVSSATSEQLEALGYT